MACFTEMTGDAKLFTLIREVVAQTSYTSILEGTGDGMFYIQKEGGAQLLILIREVMTHRHHILAS